MKIKVVLFTALLLLLTPLAVATADSIADQCTESGKTMKLSGDQLAEYVNRCIRENGGTTPATSNTAKSSSSTTTFENPIGYTSLKDLLSSVLSNLMGLILLVAVIFIVLGGIMYLISAGNEEMVTRAKKTLTGAIIGLAIALAAPTFLKEIRNLLGGGASTNTQSWISNALTFKDIATNILKWLLSIFGIVAVISLIVGGAMYLTAYGDDDRIKKAKSIITYAIIGIIVALAALIIVRQLGNLLGAQFS